LIRVIGQGSYGKVYLVNEKGTDSYFAMKELRKDVLKKKNQVEHTKTERRILERIKHPFVVSLNYAF